MFSCHSVSSPSVTVVGGRLDVASLTVDVPEIKDQTFHGVKLCWVFLIKSCLTLAHYLQHLLTAKSVVNS